MLDQESSISDDDSTDGGDCRGASEPPCYAMRLWSMKMEDLTLLDAMHDIAPIYNYLLEHLDINKFGDKLRSDPDLWID